MDAPCSYSGIELVQMTKPQDQDILIGYKQSLCQILASNYFPLQFMDWSEIMHFLAMTLNLQNLPWVRFMTSP